MNKKSEHLLYRNHLLLFLTGTFIGAVIFFIIYGFKIINPTYDDWIFSKGGDFAQHYIGWKFYRKSDWDFPICLIDGLSGNTKVSCMFTDSIPLFALFFKVLSPLLPETFQYSGLWGLFCFCMMGGVSSLLLRHFNKNTIFCILGSIFFILSPPIIQRMFGHEGLAGQWIIVIAIILWVCHNRKWKYKATPVILWAFLGIIAVLVHFYFVPMIYAIMLGYAITDILHNKKIIRPIACFASTTATVLLTMFVIGAFYGKESIKAKGLGLYSANYNSLFNPLQYSKFLKAMNYNKGQSEGFGYLGLGIITAIIIAFVIVIFLSEDSVKSLKDLKTKISDKLYIIIPVFIVVAVSMFFSASPVGTLNAKTIYTINYPQKIKDILAIFRASGRFIWIVDYIVYTGVFAIISQLNKKRTIISIVTLCLCIQLLDLKDFIMEKHSYFTTPRNYVSKLDGNLDKISQGADEIVFLPFPENLNSKTKILLIFGEYASCHNMKMSCFYMARTDFDSLSKYAQQKYEKLINGNGEENILYVFFSEKDIPETNKNLHIYKVSDYTVARYIPEN